MADVAIRDALLTMLLTGHESSAIAMAQSMAWRVLAVEISGCNFSSGSRNSSLIPRT